MMKKQKKDFNHLSDNFVTFLMGLALILVLITFILFIAVWIN